MFHLGAALLQNLAVSPELTLRPSLSDVPGRGLNRDRRVSPELTLRPSLSAPGGGASKVRPVGVAGANAPAFVERLLGFSGRRPPTLCRRS